jgi:hypothetical protein
VRASTSVHNAVNRKFVDVGNAENQGNRGNDLEGW